MNPTIQTAEGLTAVNPKLEPLLRNKQVIEHVHKKIEDKKHKERSSRRRLLAAGGLVGSGAGLHLLANQVLSPEDLAKFQRFQDLGRYTAKVEVPDTLPFKDQLKLRALGLGDVTPSAEFDNSKQLLTEYAIRGSEAMQAKPFGRPAIDVINKVRPIVEGQSVKIDPETIRNDTSRSVRDIANHLEGLTHYDSFSEGPVSAFHHQLVKRLVGARQDPNTTLRLFDDTPKTPEQLELWKNLEQQFHQSKGLTQGFPNSPRDAVAEKLQEELSQFMAQKAPDKLGILANTPDNVLNKLNPLYIEHVLSDKTLSEDTKAQLKSLVSKPDLTADDMVNFRQQAAKLLSPAQQADLVNTFDGFVKARDPEFYPTYDKLTRNFAKQQAGHVNNYLQMAKRIKGVTYDAPKMLGTALIAGGLGLGGLAALSHYRKKKREQKEEELKQQAMNKQASDKLKGGLGDNKPDSKFNHSELKKGVKVEKEHTPDKTIRKEIAKDHLTEDPKYYTKLQTMHKEAAKKKAKKLPDNYVKMDGLGPVAADYLSSWNFGGRRAGRVAQMAEDMGEEAPFNVRHPQTTNIPFALGGGALGAGLGALIGGAAAPAPTTYQPLWEGDSPTIYDPKSDYQLGGSLIGGGLGALGGALLAAKLRRNQMREIMERYENTPADEIHPEAPQVGSPWNIFNSLSGPHNLGRAEAYRDARSGEVHEKDNVVPTINEVGFRLAAPAPYAVGMVNRQQARNMIENTKRGSAQLEPYQEGFIKAAVDFGYSEEEALEFLNQKLAAEQEERKQSVVATIRKLRAEGKPVTGKAIAEAAKSEKPEAPHVRFNKALNAAKERGEKPSQELFKRMHQEDKAKYN